MCLCTCMTKTPELEYHKKDCAYRLSMEPKGVNSWISVEDRLPEDGQQVLTFFEITGVEIAKYQNLKGTKDEIFGHNCFYNGKGYLTDDVTHWMPLPKPPKEM